jgi:hypothetical protein
MSKEWWIAIIVFVLAISGLGNSILKEFGISGLMLGPPPMSLTSDNVHCKDYFGEGTYTCTIQYTVTNKTDNPVSLEDTCFVTIEGSNYSDGQLKQHFLNPGESASAYCFFEGISGVSVIESVSLRDSNQVVDAKAKIDATPLRFTECPPEWDYLNTFLCK